MIKFAKFMYELGYKAAIKEVLHEVDRIPNEKPNEALIGSGVQREEIFKKRMSIAWAIHSERTALKNFVHSKFDPSYTPEPNAITDDVRGYI